jgi:hypothetical protein
LYLAYFRVPTGYGKSGISKWSGKSQGTFFAKVREKSWNFSLKSGIKIKFS